MKIKWIIFSALKKEKQFYLILFFSENLRTYSIFSEKIKYTIYPQINVHHTWRSLHLIEQKMLFFHFYESKAFFHTSYIWKIFIHGSLEFFTHAKILI